MVFFARARLITILNTGGFEPPMIVFVNQKKAADVLMKDIARAHVSPSPSSHPSDSVLRTSYQQWNVTTLHSGKNQEQREAALNSIRNGECDVLVATDLAGRGIDVPDVSLVVNFQMSNNIEAYVHRIGSYFPISRIGTGRGADVWVGNRPNWSSWKAGNCHHFPFRQRRGTIVRSPLRDLPQRADVLPVATTSRLSLRNHQHRLVHPN